MTNTNNTVAMMDDDAMSPVELWEQELDIMGHHAPIADLKAHLAAAPEGAPSKEALVMFLSGVQNTEQAA